jgi:mannose-1-phosphate guanylyltransferase
MLNAPLPSNRVWPVILSGGSGTRLWPLSRSAMPKQLLPLAGAETMIVTTAGRTADAAMFQPALVVTGAAHAAIIREQLGDSALLIVEPAARNTAPAIALAMLAVEALDPDGVLLVMPSDHQVAAPAVLMAAVQAASGQARAGWLVTFGIRAATPETGYGYIRAGEPIGDGVRAAAEFIEKPVLARAEMFVADGGYSWNSGIFLFSVKAMRAALAAHAPAVLAAADAAMAAAARTTGRIDPDAAAFGGSPSISIDHAVFEHAAHVAVCPVDPGWSDIGSWDALYALGPADATGNVALGRVEQVDTDNCLLRADGVILTTVGVSDLNIIATPDAVLVTARGRSQDVRTVAGRLAGDLVLTRPLVRQRAWGEERIVHDGGGILVRKVTLADGASVAVAASAGIMLVAGRARYAGADLVAGQWREGGEAVTGEAAAVILLFG